MTHADLISNFLTLHVAIGGTALAVFYYYSDRSDSTIGPLNSTSTVLGELRRQISNDLQTRLEPIFQSPGSVPTPLITLDGGSYIEKPVNPINSEAFRECIRDFLDSSADYVDEYRQLLAARRNWCRWSIYLSWLLIALLVWQGIVLVTLWLDKAEFYSLLDLTVYVASVISLCLAVACVGCVACRHYHFGTISGLRLKHGQL
jgi:hypothetical protein